MKSRWFERIQNYCLRPLKQRILEVGSALSGSGSFHGHPDQAFGHLSYAQHGEDMILMNIFHGLGIARPSWIDVGAHHPVTISNTALLYAQGWRGINIEANPALIATFQKLRPGDLNLNVGIAPLAGTMKFYRIDDRSGRNTFRRETAEAFVRSHPQFRITDVVDVPTETLDSIVDRYAGGRYPEMLLIDAEGMDYDILRSVDFAARGKPVVICVEHVTGDGSDGSGAIAALLRTRGFLPIFRTVGNLLWIDEATALQQGISAPIGSHHELFGF